MSSYGALQDSQGSFIGNPEISLEMNNRVADNLSETQYSDKSSKSNYAMEMFL